MKQTIYYKASGYDRTIYNFFIIDRETKPGVAQVGTTPDPQLLFPEEDKEKETEYKSMETKW